MVALEDKGTGHGIRPSRAQKEAQVLSITHCCPWRSQVEKTREEGLEPTPPGREQGSHRLRQRSDYGRWPQALLCPLPLPPKPLPSASLLLSWWICSEALGSQSKGQKWGWGTGVNTSSFQAPLLGVGRKLRKPWPLMAASRHDPLMCPTWSACWRGQHWPASLRVHGS